MGENLRHWKRNKQIDNVLQATINTEKEVTYLPGTQSMKTNGQEIINPFELCMVLHLIVQVWIYLHFLVPSCFDISFVKLN